MAGEWGGGGGGLVRWEVVEVEELLSPVHHGDKPSQRHCGRTFPSAAGKKKAGMKAFCSLP